MSKVDDVASAIYPDTPRPRTIKSFAQFVRANNRRRGVARKAIEAMRSVTLIDAALDGGEQ